MKTQKWPPSAKSIGLSMLALSLIFALGSCSNKVAFLPSRIVPAAKGHIKVKKDHNNNFLIKLKINNLAGSSQLTPPKKPMLFGL